MVSDVFFRVSAGTLTAELQPLRDAVEERYTWNTHRVLIGHTLAKSAYMECEDTYVGVKKLGVLLPGCTKASAVIDKYLNGLID